MIKKENILKTNTDRDFDLKIPNSLKYIHNIPFTNRSIINRSTKKF